MTNPNIKNLIVYNSSNDISYIEYNKSGIPFMFDTTYIYHNNQNYNDGSFSSQVRNISNNLIIESATSNIIMSTAENKKVIVKNSMAVNNNLDVSNIITTNRLSANDISLSNILYLNNSGGINIVGNVNIRGQVNFSDRVGKEVGFKGDNTFFSQSTFADGDISDSRIISSEINLCTIKNSYISNSAIGYDENNNILRSKAVFTDVSLQSLSFDGSQNGQNVIKFPNAINNNFPTLIQNSNDYSKLEINKPLIIGTRPINTNISNISIFNGDISCNTLYYSQLRPDIRLNNYFDVSIGAISVSGNIIPITNTFNIGSTDYKFNEIYSSRFIGDLSGIASIANDLRKNLDMSFRNLDINGIIRLNGNNLSQTLTGTYLTISGANISFGEITTKISDLSTNVYSKQEVDLCLNTIYVRRPAFELSFQELSGRIVSLSGNVHSRTFVDTCLNTNYVKTSPTNASQFRIFDDKFIFESSGNYIQKITTSYNSSIISEWRTNWLSTDNPVIRFHANGDITNINNSYGGWSDIRLKENIVNTGPKLQDLLKVRIVNYNLKGLASSNKHIGVIAQELETIFPSLVSENEPTPEDISAGKTESYKSVNYSCFTLMLIKALQEEQEIINNLETKITTLNEDYNVYKDLQVHTKSLVNIINTLKEENVILKYKLNEILSKLGKNSI
jgi:hypothetical protein